MELNAGRAIRARRRRGISTQSTQRAQRTEGRPREFRLPGGLTGAVLAGVFPLLLLSLAMAESNHETVLGMKGLLFGVLIIMGGFLTYFVTGKLKIRKTKPVVVEGAEEA